MPTDTVTARRTTAIDHLVGTRIRMRRQSLGMSQTELGKRIGVTFQQVQKYEIGTNRVGASRLAAIAAVLGVPVTFFFAELKPAVESPGEEDAVAKALHDRSTVQLVKAFAAVSDPLFRQRILDLVRAAAGNREPGQAKEEVRVEGLPIKKARAPSRVASKPGEKQRRRDGVPA